jgi:hypothetical protein
VRGLACWYGWRIRCQELYVGLQYASFQDRHHLYFLFDLLPGGDLMDILVAEARVVKVRSTDASLSPGCLAPKQKILKVKLLLAPSGSRLCCTKPAVVVLVTSSPLHNSVNCKFVSIDCNIASHLSAGSIACTVGTLFARDNAQE